MSAAEERTKRTIKKWRNCYEEKLLAILLSMVMLVGLMPFTALAADSTAYDIG